MPPELVLTLEFRLSRVLMPPLRLPHLLRCLSLSRQLTPCGGSAGTPFLVIRQDALSQHRRFHWPCLISVEACLTPSQAIVHSWPALLVRTLSLILGGQRPTQVAVGSAIFFRCRRLIFPLRNFRDKIH